MRCNCIRYPQVPVNSYRRTYTIELQTWIVLVHTLYLTIEYQPQLLYIRGTVYATQRKHKRTGTRPNNSIVNEDEEGKALTLTMSVYDI